MSLCPARAGTGRVSYRERARELDKAIGFVIAKWWIQELERGGGGGGGGGLQPIPPPTVG